MVYTDGACSPNPGPGGCSAVLLYEKHRKEIAEGYRHHCVFHWIKGHDRTKEHIRCDELAVAAGKKPRLAVDHGYEKTRRLRQNLFLPQLPDASGGSKR